MSAQYIELPVSVNGQDQEQPGVYDLLRIETFEPSLQLRDAPPIRAAVTIGRLGARAKLGIIEGETIAPRSQALKVSVKRDRRASLTIYDADVRFTNITDGIRLPNAVEADFYTDPEELDIIKPLDEVFEHYYGMNPRVVSFIGPELVRQAIDYTAWINPTNEKTCFAKYALQAALQCPEPIYGVAIPA